MRQYHRIKRVLHLKSSQSGAALLEFGLVLPILMLLLFGSIEIMWFLYFQQKIDNTTMLAGDAITQIDAVEVECGTGRGELGWVYTTLAEDIMEPFEWGEDDAKGRMIISAVEAEYADPLSPDDSATLVQTVRWQWSKGAGGNASQIGNAGSPVAGGNPDDVWPGSFYRSPNDNGMFDGERIIAVEVFYDYELFLPGVDVLFNVDEFGVYKVGFFRARFGNMTNLGDAC